MSDEVRSDAKHRKASLLIAHRSSLVLTSGRRTATNVTMLLTVKRICVFCGSSHGRNPRYADAARQVGSLLARENVGIVYGGGGVGLMGLLADAALAAGGEVIGVIPRALVNREVAYSGLADLRIVSSMHERKALMADLADAFLALPGGLGTIEELFEIVTWAQLGIHRKPTTLLDVDGYFRPLTAFLDHMVSEGFISEANRDLVLVCRRPDEILETLRSNEPQTAERWLDDEQR